MNGCKHSWSRERKKKEIVTVFGLNAPGSVVRWSMCAGVTDTFIAGENRDKQREEEQRENRDHDVMISLGWYHLVEVSLIEVCEEERKRTTTKRERREREQGLVPITDVLKQYCTDLFISTHKTKLLLSDKHYVKKLTWWRFTFVSTSDS